MSLPLLTLMVTWWWLATVKTTQFVFNCTAGISPCTLYATIPALGSKDFGAGVAISGSLVAVVVYFAYTVHVFDCSTPACTLFDTVITGSWVNSLSFSNKLLLIGSNVGGSYPLYDCSLALLPANRSLREPRCLWQAGLLRATLWRQFPRASWRPLLAKLLPATLQPFFAAIQSVGVLLSAAPYLDQVRSIPSESVGILSPLVILLAVDRSLFSTATPSPAPRLLPSAL